MADASDTFASTDSGASKTFPIQAGELKKGSFVVIKDRPCKVVETSTSKTGKHGHAKVNITALDIFNGRKYEDMCPSSHNVEAPFISRKEFTLTDINKDDGNLAVLMDEDGNLREDLRVDTEDPDHKPIWDAYNKAAEEGKSFELTVVVLAAMGIEKIILKSSA